MGGCSVTKGLEIVRGGLSDYKQLSRYHYRDSRTGPFAAIYAIKATRGKSRRLGKSAIGIIVYAMPSIGLELRNVATGNYFSGLDRSTRLGLINKHIRCISRVIIEPRFRSLGLASWLVRETMGEMDAAIIESLAVMGRVNPFFEKAGMKSYAGPMPARCVQMLEAFSVVGIEKEELLRPEKVEWKLATLGKAEAKFIERQIQCFLASYGKRRNMAAGSERTEFVLSKLTFRPTYYIWFNPKKALCV